MAQRGELVNRGPAIICESSTVVIASQRVHAKRGQMTGYAKQSLRLRSRPRLLRRAAPPRDDNIRYN